MAITDLVRLDEFTPVRRIHIKVVDCLWSPGRGLDLHRGLLSRRSEGERTCATTNHPGSKPVGSVSFRDRDAVNVLRATVERRLNVQFDRKPSVIKDACKISRTRHTRKPKESALRFDTGFNFRTTGRVVCRLHATRNAHMTSP